MEAGFWLLLAAIICTVTAPLWVYLVSRSTAGRLPVREQVASQEVLPEEWQFAYRQYCTPLCCPHLEGDPPASLAIGGGLVLQLLGARLAALFSRPLAGYAFLAAGFLLFAIASAQRFAHDRRPFEPATLSREPGKPSKG